MKAKRAFSLTEVLIALSLTVVVGAIALTLLLSVGKSFRYHGTQQDLALDMRQLRDVFEKRTYGAAFFEIYNHFSDSSGSPRLRQTATGGTMLVLAYTGTADYAKPDNPADPGIAKAKLIPPLSRLVGFYMDDSNPLDVRLRLFDSDAVGAGAGPGAIAWANKIRNSPTRLVPGEVGNPGRYVADLLPAPSIAAQFPSIARMDRDILHGKTQGATDANTVYQLFYAKTSMVLANLVLRSGADAPAGSDAITYQVPLTLTLVLHK